MYKPNHIISFLEIDMSYELSEFWSLEFSFPGDLPCYSSFLLGRTWSKFIAQKITSWDRLYYTTSLHKSSTVKGNQVVCSMNSNWS